MKRLAGGVGPLANFFASGVLALGPKLGPVLWPLPPVLAFDAARPRRRGSRVAGLGLRRSE